MLSASFCPIVCQGYCHTFMQSSILSQTNDFSIIFSVISRINVSYSKLYLWLALFLNWTFFNILVFSGTKLSFWKTLWLYQTGLNCTEVAVIASTPARFSHHMLHPDLKVDCSELCHTMMEWVPPSGFLNVSSSKTWRFFMRPQPQTLKLGAFGIFIPVIFE